MCSIIICVPIERLESREGLAFVGIGKTKLKLKIYENETLHFFKNKGHINNICCLIALHLTPG